MTRINCVPPSELVWYHLCAEYRELPRVFRLAVSSFRRGEEPPDSPEYILGPGHVKSFYGRLRYLEKRHAMIRKEMKKRGYAVRMIENVRGEWQYLPRKWRRDWSPTDADMALCRERLRNRVKEKDRHAYEL